MGCDVLILGGGWSGLWAADLLSKRHKKVVVLEKEPWLGGLARTCSLKNYHFDLGGHRLNLSKPGWKQEVLSLAKAEEFCRIKKISKIYFQGRYIDYPLTFTSLTRINKTLLATGLIHFFRPKLSRSPRDFEEWARHHYGKVFFESFFRGYSEKVWGLDCGQLSADWAEQRVGRLGLGLFLGARLGFQRDNATDSPKTFHYPKKGIGLLIAALERRVRENNLIYNNCAIKGFSTKGKRIQSVIFSSENQFQEIKCRHVLSSIPLPELYSIAPFRHDIKYPGVLDHLRYRSLIIVSVVIPRPIALKYHWAYFPSKDLIFSRLHEPKFWSLDMADDSPHTLVCAEIFCDHHDSVWDANDAELIQKTKEGLRKINLLGPQETALDHSIVKIRYAYPLLDRDFQKYLPAIHENINAYENVSLIGRSGTHAYFDMEQCLLNVREQTSIMDL